MIIENIENILTLIATIAGLLGCLLKYIRTLKRGYLYLVGFFLASFLSDYFWTIYTLVMGDYPEVSEFLAYLGWNAAYVFLLISVFHMRAKGARRYFHPVILLPIIPNTVQFIIYIQYGGIFNNVWQVGTTTAVMVLCLQDIAYYLKNKNSGMKAPRLSVLILLYLITEYTMWTVSCFDWPNQYLNPYIYISIAGDIIVIFFGKAAEKDYGTAQMKNTGVSLSEFRFQTLFQVAISVVIFGSCAAGFIISVKIKNSMSGSADDSSGKVTALLFVISAVLILLVLVMTFAINRRYRYLTKKAQTGDHVKRNRYSLILTMSVTLVLMIFLAVYNSVILYEASVTGLYEDGKDVVETKATDLDNYLTVAETTLRVAADTVDLMKQSGASQQAILDYLTDQTSKQSEQFDENFTGIYAYIDQTFMDGSGWVPPEGYDPVTRDWYVSAVEAGGKVIIVSPYVDAHTGSIVITFAKCINYDTAGGGAKYNVVALDVIFNYVQEVAEKVNIAGKGYGMVVNTDGFIVGHKIRDNSGNKVQELYGADTLESIVDPGIEQFETTLDGEECVVFVHPVMEQWFVLIAVNKAELFSGVYSQVAVNIFITIATFLLITFFYYFGYKIEQNNGKKIEEINMQVVTALAEAIDAKDTYTKGHSARVAKYSKMIASRAGYSSAKQDEIYMMGLLHDVGKIGVPDEVINKPAKLTIDEYGIIKTHPVIGSKILENIKERPRLSVGARWHHERYGGGGYPDGISGEEIPEEARIIAVADAYDAMTSRRSYRDVMPQQRVREEIENGIGSQFDPRFAKEMLAMIDEDKEYTLREQ